MGEGSHRVGNELSPRVTAVSGEIDTLRNELGSLVAELDRRRVEALDIRLQIRRHPVAVAIVATGAALVVGGLVAVAVRRRRKRNELSVRAREVRRAFGAIVKDPYHVARESTLTEKIVATAATTAATLLVKRVLDQWLPPASAQSPRPPRRTRAAKRGGVAASATVGPIGLASERR